MIIALIGTRNPVSNVLPAMVSYIAEQNIVPIMIRSGNAQGVDQYANFFSRLDGVVVAHYLPWKDYNKELRIEKPNVHYVYKPAAWADVLIKEMFPWVLEKQTKGLLYLIRRNAQIILGQDGNRPCTHVFYHTDEVGTVKGGTAYGVKIAKKYNIPVKFF